MHCIAAHLQCFAPAADNMVARLKLVHCSALYCTAVYFIALLCMTLNYIVLHSLELYCTAVYCIALLCMTLQCIILQYIAFALSPFAVQRVLIAWWRDPDWRRTSIQTYF